MSSKELIDNWEDMTYRGRPVSVTGEGAIVLFTSEPPGLESTHPSLAVVDIWSALVDGTHPSVYVITPGYPRRAMAKGVRVIEMPGLPQLREVVNNGRRGKTTHFTQELYNRKSPQPTLCGSVNRPYLKRFFFTEQPQVWHLGRTNNTCSRCKQAIRDLFGVGNERFHSVISHMGHRETENEPEDALRGLIFFEDDAENKNARILVLDPVRTNWPNTGEIEIGSDSFFVGNR